MNLVVNGSMQEITISSLPTLQELYTLSRQDGWNDLHYSSPYHEDKILKLSASLVRGSTSFCISTYEAKRQIFVGYKWVDVEEAYVRITDYCCSP